MGHLPKPMATQFYGHRCSHGQWQQQSSLLLPGQCLPRYSKAHRNKDANADNHEGKPKVPEVKGNIG